MSKRKRKNEPRTYNEPRIYTCIFYRWDSDIVGDIIHCSKALGVSKKEIVKEGVKEYINQIKKIESYDKT